MLPAFGVTPYSAVQFQDFHTPAYSESDLTGGGFGLSYNAMNATDVRTELGARFDDPTVVYGKPLVLFGRVAWAHDFVSNPALSAAFEALPGGRVHGQRRADPADSALTTRGRAALPHAAMDVARQVRGRIRAQLANLRRHRDAALYVVRAKQSNFCAVASQLGDVDRDPPRLVAREPVHRGAPASVEPPPASGRPLAGEFSLGALAYGLVRLL